METSSYERAIQLFERARAQMRSSVEYDLSFISLVSSLPNI